jgi:type I restriction-modification system DNA methylase subunit
MTLTLMDKFEQTIGSIRNILRVEGITGLDSINHCIALIIARYLTIKKCEEFEIPSIFAFENFLKNADGSPCDDQTAIAKFYTQNADNDCLFANLYDKLNFNTFKFKINAPLNFLNIYKKLADINIETLSDTIDIVGAIYELHLKTGTTGSGMRDLGQYFTNREVIKYMINLCNPVLKPNGEIETILDPSMGTGGFLTMSIKHFNQKYKNINWNINKDRIYGFDVDETVKNMSILNALLESGKIFSKTFVKNDTLHNDFKISENVLIDKVDIILANEPFGLKNIIHKNVCKRIKDMKIEGTKAEPLFLQLMMQSLNDKGRCAVIVPDGVLFNDAKLHKLTRKYLCGNLRLVKVISLEDGLFLNTGVKSSILFFVNDGKTEVVDFCKIKLSSDGKIEEESVIKVNIKEIVNNDYSLFVNKYNQVTEVKIEGLEYKKLGECCIMENGKQLDKKDIIDGEYPVVSGGVKPNGYHNIYNRDENTISIACTGSVGYTQFNKTKIWLSQAFSVKPKTNNLDNKYLYYYIKLYLESKFSKMSKATAQPYIRFTDIENIKIPLPPLSLQQEIVEALDPIFETIELNNKLIQNYEKAKKAIVRFNTLFCEKKKLGDVAELNKNNITKNYKNKTIKYIDISSVNKGSINIETIKEFNVGNEPCRAKRIVNINDVLLSTVRPNLENYLFIDNKIYSENLIASTGFAVITPIKINGKYLYNYISSPEITQYLVNNATGAMYPSVDNNTINDLQIPIPSLEVQEYIVKECSHYDNLIDILKKENEKLQNNNIIELALKSNSNVQLESVSNVNSDNDNQDIFEADIQNNVSIEESNIDVNLSNDKSPKNKKVKSKTKKMVNDKTI